MSIRGAVHRPRLMMIGLDAAELALIEAHRPMLPALDRALAAHPMHRLASTAGALPGSVWPTFATGTLPGVHGIYHPLQWDPGAMRIRRVSREWLACEPFWYALERRDLDIAVLDVPMMFPPRRSRGAEILNWGSHDQLGPFAAYPRELGDELRRRFGARHPMGYEIPVTKTPSELARIRRNLVAGARRKGEVARWLYELRDWDLFVVVFGETHRGGHILWPEADGTAALAPLLDVYAAVDAAIGMLLDAAAAHGATVVLFALHGMGANTSQEHFVPRVMDRVNAAFAARAAPAAAAPNAPVAPPRRPGFVRTLRERVPARLQNAIAQAVPVAVRDAVVSRQITGGHDWAHTPGVALLADLNGYLRFNLRGREARGSLEPGSAALHDYRTWLADCLTSLRVAETDAPLVGELITPATFPGERSAFLPDVIVGWTGAPPATRLHSPLLGDIDAELATGRGGNHRFEGFCVVVPPSGVAASVLPSPPRHIVDLAAFARAVLGIHP